MSEVSEAVKKIKEGDLEAARRQLEKLATADPENPRIAYNLGVCYTRMGMMAKSVPYLERCLEKDPDNVNAHTVLAFSYAHLEKFDRALELLKRAIELDPANFYAAKNLGAISAQKGNHKEATGYFRKALDLKPDNSEVLYGLALAHEEMGERDEAVNLYEKIVALPHGGEVKDWAADALERLKTGKVSTASGRMDIVLYCLHALRLFSTMEKKELRVAVQEIAEMVESGIDDTDPAARYSLNAVDGEFTGLQLVCYLYVGLVQMGEDLDIGADISHEYEAAYNIFQSERTGEA